MCTSRDFKTGPKLPGHRGPTHPFRGLQHQHGTPTASQVGGTHQPIVAAAYDNAVVAAHCDRPKSRRIAPAALKPGAPITPPPGCVLDPHIYIPRTGARYCAYPGIGRLNSNWSKVSSPWKILPSVRPTSFSIS